MSGHSKWANIKRKKEANDKVKGAAFSKLSRLITLAVIEGGNIPDPVHNFKLRLAIDKARSYNMPKENIARAIEKASGGDKNTIKEIMYEGFGPHGVAMMIQATSDNINRTVSEIKNILERGSGKLGSQGSVSYLFQKCVLVEFEAKDNKEEDVFNFAEALEAIDIDQTGDLFFVYIPFGAYGKVKDHLEKVKPRSTEIDFKPTALISVENDKQVGQIITLAETLEAMDDVHKVFTNLDIPETYEG